MNIQFERLTDFLLKHEEFAQFYYMDQVTCTSSCKHDLSSSSLFLHRFVCIVCLLWMIYSLQLHVERRTDAGVRLRAIYRPVAGPLIKVKRFAINTCVLLQTNWKYTPHIISRSDFLWLEWLPSAHLETFLRLLYMHSVFSKLCVRARKYYTGFNLLILLCSIGMLISYRLQWKGVTSLNPTRTVFISSDVLHEWPWPCFFVQPPTKIM